VSIKKSYPLQANKMMHGLWGMGQMMLIKYIVVVEDGVLAYGVSESAVAEDCCRLYSLTR